MIVYECDSIENITSISTQTDLCFGDSFIETGNNCIAVSFTWAVGGDRVYNHHFCSVKKNRNLSICC
jgi:hypothetical protein